MKKRIIQIIGIVAILVAIFYFAIYRPINKYTDTHTWATIRMVEEVDAETFDVFMGKHEYLKGDTESFHSAEVLIQDITHEGTVTFFVCEGALYDDNGEQVTEFVLNLGEQRTFSEEDGRVDISVIGSRYQ